MLLTRIQGVKVLTLHAKYVWQRPQETSWVMGTYDEFHMFDRAIPGEY